MKDMRKTKAQLVEELTELRESSSRQRPDRQLLSVIADQMREPTVILDWDGTVLHGNALAAKVIGAASPDDLSGMSLASVMHPEDLGRAVADLSAVEQSAADFSAVYRLLVDGRTIHIESHGTRIDLSDGSVDLVTFREVRERANEMILKGVLDHSSTVIFIKDTDGRYLLVNRRYEALFGVTYNEIAGKTDFDIFPADAAERFQAMDRRAIEAGRPIEEEELVPHEDGMHTYISVKFPIHDARGNTYAVGGISTDITERKRAEEALASHHDELEERVEARTRELKEAEERAAIFRRFAEASGQGFGMADLDGKVTYLNPAVCRFLGLEGPEEGIGCHFSECHPEEMRRTLVREILPTVLKKGEWIGEMPLLHKNGEPVPMILNMFSIRDEAGEPQALAAVLTDITGRKKAEEAIAESERKFRSLAESTTAHICIVQGDRYVYANQAFLDYFETDMEDLRLITPEDLMMGVLTEEAIRDAAPAWQAAVESGERRFRFEYQDVEGRWFQTNVTMMELEGEPSFLVMSFDITELKRAQEKIEENERRYRTIFDTAATAMISCGDDAVITLANDEWVNLTGYSKEETEGKLTWMPFFTGETLERMKRYHEMRSKDPTAAPRFYEAQLIDRRGQAHDGIVTVNLVPGTQQRVASFQDLTELKRAQKEMYRADKMAALGQIIAGVAHEINNPNNFIYFNLPILRKYIEAIAPLLEDRLEKQPDLKILNMPYGDFRQDVFKLLENMEHGSERITSIVSDLRNYVRSDEEEDRKAEEIGHVIERVMTLVGKQVRKMVKRFDVDVADNLPPVPMNVGKIEQVLINLLINAGQAADKEDSRVRLTARPATDPAGWIELCVEDNGMGIPEESLEQIFEPFFTSKGGDQGTGLGLSISHRIIEEHGGQIRVESQPGEGARFTVLLPARIP